jgi:hypothetical protein
VGRRSRRRPCALACWDSSRSTRPHASRARRVLARDLQSLPIEHAISWSPIPDPNHSSRVRTKGRVEAVSVSTGEESSIL